LESIIELCYMSAHHYILAGTEWAGTAQFQSHAHRDNPRLMKQAQTPQDVVRAWEALEIFRSGYIYGAKSDVVAANQARDHLKTIIDWAKALHP
jgi:hypothetical protein